MDLARLFVRFDQEIYQIGVGRSRFTPIFAAPIPTQVAEW